MENPKQWIAEKHLYLIVILLLIWIMAVRLPLDSDMWWHLRAGRETLAQGSVYRVDTFSHTREGSDWINHSWLSQVLMAGIFELGSFPGLSIWVAACAVLSLGLVYPQLDGHPLLRGTVLILAATVSSVVWSPRPQIMSLVLLALVGLLVFKFIKNGKWIYLAILPPVFALWGNLHGGYVLGLIYLGSVLIGAFIDWILIPDDVGNIGIKSWVKLMGASFASGLAVLINPFGLEMWKIPFNTVGLKTLQDLINEWASPDFHQAFQQPFLIMLFGLLFVFGLSTEKVPSRTLVPVILFSWAALTARRNFGPFAIVAAPPLATYGHGLLREWINSIRIRWRGLDDFLKRAESNKQEFSPIFRNLINSVLIALLIFAAVIKTIEVNRDSLFAEQEMRIFPAGAASWLEQTDYPVRLFNDYNWGGYLIFRSPSAKVFIDGRTDLYGDDILLDYLSVINGGEGWQNIIERYGVNCLLVPRETNIAKLANISGYSVLYEDERAIILGMDK